MLINASSEEDAFYWRIGVRLAVCRVRRGQSVAEAATDLGIATATLRSYESGRRRVSAYDLVRFARTYGVDLSWLVQPVVHEQSLRARVRELAAELFELTETEGFSD